ncbi:MAG: 1-phosphofructokinase family hexose kinase [Stackebrandtia sp.]
MIVTVTLNPSLDHTLDVESLRPGRMNRAGHTRLDPGGKGVNVSRALVAHGIATRAVLPHGGHEGAQLVELLEAERVTLAAVPIAGRTRSNVTLVESDGTVTKVNEPGAPLTGTELLAITETVLEVSAAAEWVVVSGAAPPGVSVSDFTRLCRRLVEAGVRLAVDTSGPWLRAAARAGAHLVKPNRRELSEVVETELPRLEDIARAATTLQSWGAHTVLASLAADGAVLADESGVHVGTPPPVTARSNVGAGDAMLAGFLASGASGTPSLIEALAWGAAAAALPGSTMPTPGDVSRSDIVVRPGPDPHLSLLD